MTLCTDDRMQSNDNAAKHTTYHHLTLAENEKINRWMIAETNRRGSTKLIQSKTIAQFSQCFKSGHWVSYIRENILWNDSENIISHGQNCERNGDNMGSI